MSDALPGPGARLGRYVVLDELGSGAMGMVLAAYDPELDRKVAIKLVRPDVAGNDTGRHAHVRLLREAQSMAKLSHPNVVAVHDVGTVGDQIFIAMEHVEGETLEDWVAQGPHPWRDTLEVFRHAGRGLAAAHAAKLIHRDFKPANVLIGSDGRVRVGDFGIAGHVLAAEAEAHERRAPAGRRITSDGDLTQAGDFLGTPLYASMEQLSGGTIDPRSDQFSFCVALWEALFGERPFAGDTVFELLIAIEEQNVGSVPEDSDVPPSVVDALARGLAAQPDERFPSMDALLDSLEAAPEALLAGIWDDARRETIHAAFLATGRPFAASTWEAVEPLLDTYARSWSSWHRDAWDATHVRNEQSEEVLDLRMRFLEQRREELRALTDLFAHADATVVQAAIEAAHGLTDLAGCADLPLLRSMLPPPRDAATKKRVALVRQKLSEANALVAANKLSAAAEVGLEAVSDAEGSGYRPAVAEAMALLGDVERRMGQSESAELTLIRAAAAAESCRHDRVKAKAFIDLVYVVGYRMASHREGHTWGRFAAAALDRIGGDDVLRARLFNNIGSVFWSQGDYDKARESNQRALELREKTLGTDHPAVADSLNNLGVVASRQRHYDEAIGHYARALSIFEHTLGSDHPNVAAALSNLGTVLRDQGSYVEAIMHFERAVDILERALGGSHGRVATMLKNLGQTLLTAGAPADAIAPLERALELREARGTGKTYGAIAFMLARAVWEARRDRDRAIALAWKARNAIEPTGAAQELERIDAWIEELGEPEE